jgi:cytochrome c oxidase cbb3-type subunit 3
MRAHPVPLTACLCLLGLTFASCEREERRFQELAPSSSPAQGIQLSELQPGEPLPRPPTKSQYEKNAYAINEGKRLYQWFNCSGCHSQGGGGMGPALMDSKWRYGSEPENIYATIVEGRPNGMPSFRGKIPEQQVWQIVAYVRSISGLVRLDVAPSRSDTMSAKPPETMKTEEHPVPESVEHPR